jgi:hypothetical protein
MVHLHKKPEVVSLDTMRGGQIVRMIAPERPLVLVGVHSPQMGIISGVTLRRDGADWGYWSQSARCELFLAAEIIPDGEPEFGESVPSGAVAWIEDEPVIRCRDTPGKLRWVLLESGGTCHPMSPAFFWHRWSLVVPDPAGGQERVLLTVNAEARQEAP